MRYTDHRGEESLYQRPAEAEGIRRGGVRRQTRVVPRDGVDPPNKQGSKSIVQVTLGLKKGPSSLGVEFGCLFGEERQVDDLIPCNQRGTQRKSALKWRWNGVGMAPAA